MMTDTALARLVWRADDIQYGCSPVIMVPARHLETVERIEELLTQYAMPHDAVIWRAMETAGDLAVGDVLREPLYLCGTLERDLVAALGLVQVAIEVPEGTPIVPLGWLSDEAIAGEVLLARGAAFRIESVEEGLRGRLLSGDHRRDDDRG